MRLGDRGYEVEELQSYLIGIGLLEEKEYNYGPKTKVAVMALQEKLGYRQTGVWEEDLSLLYSLDMAQEMVMFASGSVEMQYKVGDKVQIIGDDAFYGGLSDDYGVKVPYSQKNGKQHTVMQVSEKRGEYLLKEIYSWVPAQFIDLVVEVPTPTVVDTGTDIATTEVPEVSSAVTSSIVTEVTEPEVVRTYDSIPVDAIPCYVKHLNTGSQTEFDISPETVTDNMIATFEDQIPKSRTSPFKAYANSGPRDVSFTITLYDDYCKLGILKTVRRLQALTVPTKSGGYVQEPRCKVRIGDFIDITAVCTAVTVEWAKPYKDNIYSKADVTLTFNEVEDQSVFANTWEAMG